jgi:hypothetical protein
VKFVKFVAKKAATDSTHSTDSHLRMNNCFCEICEIRGKKKQPRIARIPQIKKHIALLGSPGQSLDATERYQKSAFISEICAIRGPLCLLKCNDLLDALP